MNNNKFYEIQKEIGKVFDKHKINKELLKKNKTPIVSYEELSEQLNRVIELTKKGIKFDETFHSIFVWGPTGCLYENTTLNVVRISHQYKTQKITIKELYDIYKENPKENLLTQSINKKYNIFFNKIEEVIDSGEKECYEITTESGKKIIASEEHPFKVPYSFLNGRGVKEKDDFVQLKDLIVGDYILVTNNKSLKRLDYNKYAEVIFNTEEADYEKIYFSSEKEFDDYYLNNVDLEVFQTVYEKIIDIKSVGVLKTYDIRMRLPFSNVVANDIVVHNTGKTEIIKQIAEKHGAVYHKLEIQKVPLEELQGFPYLHKTNDGKTVVRLAHPTDLPPSDDKRLWVFHLDEFNKADTENMAAVMNLVLNGEIGGSADYNEETGKSEKYRLPEKTVIIGSGNLKEQSNVTSFNSVNNFDTATAERWHRNLFIGYNAPSWLESFAYKPYEWNGIKLSTRIPHCIIYYILDKYIETDNPEAPFLIPKKIFNNDNSEEEAESTMSPRAWTLASNQIIADAFLYWEKLNEEEKKKYNNNFDEYLQDPNVQIKCLIDNVYEFGANGNEIVSDIIGRYNYFAENRVTPEDIIYHYAENRNRIRQIVNKKGAIIYLFYGVGMALKEINDIDNITKIALNISTFITDTNISAEDLTIFIYELDKTKSEFNKKLSELLYSINERYKNSYQGYYYTGENDLV